MARRKAMFSEIELTAMAKQRVIEYFKFDPLVNIKFENNSKYSGVDILLDENRCKNLAVLFYIKGYQCADSDTWGYKIYRNELNDNQKTLLYGWLFDAITEFNEEKDNITDIIVLAIQHIKYCLDTISINDIASLCFGFYKLDFVSQQRAVYYFSRGIEDMDSFWGNIAKKDSMYSRLEFYEKKQKERSQKASKSAKAKSTTPKKIVAKNNIYKQAHDILMKNPTLSINGVAEKISNRILLNGDAQKYCINAENPKSTIYKWLINCQDWKDKKI